MFKRRIKRNWPTIVAHWFYPRGGWARALSYMAHRLRRLPDTPSKIARGVGAGVFVSFTPFFGFHFVTAVIVGFAVRGNILAALLATFFGNPLTFPLIAATSLETGNFLLGRDVIFPFRVIVSSFGDASVELWRNFEAIFTDANAEWHRLAEFFDTVFLPYLVGGMVPGFAAGLVAYFFSKPLIAAYQKHRRKKLRKKWAEMRGSAADAPAKDKGDAA
ncbi:DUF2062 domain-containing protein [Maritimibacter sp. 55A14]|uniref:DUF2062 domain-containing protein n=1 Tax=Maritimibacter sp. 55A14 TaxID=2174844 RepID=UPI000D60D1FE|nr:DUF2062 domain-containing protein [Maritimibacter sp. 55A14]PWE32491.1 DUF2062 domain-containing protein [Maritimibacter sp. 55A14]